MQAPAGWYGKLPILGDFTRRRLPPAFIDPWDAWLQAGIAGSRAALGSAWLDNYLTAHVWHFVLMPGVLGPQAWAGVWSPSVDRVGRYFPFTLAAPLAPGGTPAAVSEWLGGLEDIARLGLQLETDITPLDDALERLGPPPGDAHCTLPLQGLAERLARRDEAISLPCAGPHQPGGALQALATASLLTQLAGYSVWWCFDAERRSGGVAHRNLPDASFMVKMITYSPTD